MWRTRIRRRRTPRSGEPRRGNNNIPNKRVTVPSTIFTGEVQALDGFYFNCSNGYRTDAYDTSIKFFSAYVARECTYGTGIQHVITKMAKPQLPMPVDPTDSDTIREIWKEQVSRYVKRDGTLKENIGSLYSLILGQCTEAIKAKLSDLENFKAMDDANDAIGILRVINEIAFKFETYDNVYVSFWNMKRQVANMFQNGMTLTQIMEKFAANDIITTQTRCGIWVDVKTVIEELQLLPGIGSTPLTLAKASSDHITSAMTHIQEKQQGIFLYPARSS